MNSSSMSSIDMLTDAEIRESDNNNDEQVMETSATNGDNPEKKFSLLKYLVVGDYAVGKTSLIRRYCTQEFTNTYKITIGVDFCLKTLEKPNHEVDLQLWDIAGHERFSSMLRVFFRHAIGAIVVFDISRPSTLDNVKKWRDDINDKVELPNGKPIPMILLANKCDLPDISIDTDKMSKFARDNGFFAWFETSAKQNTNIDKAIDCLTDEVLKITKTLEIQRPAADPDTNNFNLVDETRNSRTLAGAGDPSSPHSRKSGDQVPSAGGNEHRGGRGEPSGRRAKCCNTG